MWNEKFFLWTSFYSKLRLNSKCFCQLVFFPKLHGRLHRVHKPWSSPHTGWLKANLDGAFDQAISIDGLGVVVRESSGNVVPRIFIKIQHVDSPKAVEALAGRAVCSLAARYHLSQILFRLILLFWLILQSPKLSMLHPLGGTMWIFHLFWLSF